MNPQPESEPRLGAEPGDARIHLGRFEECICDDTYGDNPWCPIHEYEEQWP